MTEIILEKDELIKLIKEFLTHTLNKEVAFDHWKDYMGDGMVFTMDLEID